MISGSSQKQNLSPATGFKSLFFAELLLLLSFPAAKINVVFVPVLYIIRVILKIRGLFGMQKRSSKLKTAGIFFALSMLAWSIDYSGTGAVKVVAEIFETFLDFLVVYFVCHAAVELLASAAAVRLAALAPKISGLYFVGTAAALLAILLTKCVDGGLPGRIVYYAAVFGNVFINLLYTLFLHQCHIAFRRKN